MCLLAPHSFVQELLMSPILALPPCHFGQGSSGKPIFICRATSFLGAIFEENLLHNFMKYENLFAIQGNKLIIRVIYKVIIPTFKYGLITHFKYPESRLFTYNLLGIRHHKIMKSEYQQVSKIESALMIVEISLL